MKKEFNLSDKRIVYSNASGRGLVRYEEKDIKEFIKNLMKMGLSKWDYEEQGFVLHISHKEINKLAGKELI